MIIKVGIHFNTKQLHAKSAALKQQAQEFVATNCCGSAIPMCRLTPVCSEIPASLTASRRTAISCGKRPMQPYSGMPVLPVGCVEKSGHYGHGQTMASSF